MTPSRNAWRPAPRKRSWSGALLVAAGLAVAACAALTVAAEPPLGQPRPLASVDTRSGHATYEANCAACHGYLGEGLVGAYPPLAGSVPGLLGTRGGRDYLMGVLLHGLSGAIEVSGRTFDGIMPPWGHLSDQHIAAVLNHIGTAWGNRELLPDEVSEFTALEVSLKRGFPDSQAELAADRQALTRSLEQ